MKKLVAPEGCRLLKAGETLRPNDGYMNKFGELQYSNPFAGMKAKSSRGYGIVYAYFRRKQKPKKPRPKKSLAQIAYDAFWSRCGREFAQASSDELNEWQSVSDAVAREVRKRIKQQKEQK